MASSRASCAGRADGPGRPGGTQLFTVSTRDAILPPSTQTTSHCMPLGLRQVRMKVVRPHGQLGILHAPATSYLPRQPVRRISGDLRSSG